MSHSALFLAAKNPDQAERRPPDRSPNLPVLLSLPAAARELGISLRLLRLLEERGHVRFTRLGGRCLCPRAEIERLARDGAPLT